MATFDSLPDEILLKIYSHLAANAADDATGESHVPQYLTNFADKRTLRASRGALFAAYTVRNPTFSLLVFDPVAKVFDVREDGKVDWQVEQLDFQCEGLGHHSQDPMYVAARVQKVRLDVCRQVWLEGDDSLDEAEAAFVGERVRAFLRGAMPLRSLQISVRPEHDRGLKARVRQVVEAETREKECKITWVGAFDAENVDEVDGQERE